MIYDVELYYSRPQDNAEDAEPFSRNEDPVDEEIEE